MTYICYRGIEVSANMQKGLLAIEAGMLVVFAVVALTKIATGNAPGEPHHPVVELVQPVRHLVALGVRRGV